jgi:hypothetical protein
MSPFSTPSGKVTFGLINQLFYIFYVLLTNRPCTTRVPLFASTGEHFGMFILHPNDTLSVEYSYASYH